MKPDDLVITTSFPKCEGGQQVGTPSPMVSVKHTPSGIEAACGYERSMLKNRAVAVAMVERGLEVLGWSGAVAQ